MNDNKSRLASGQRGFGRSTFGITAARGGHHPHDVRNLLPERQGSLSLRIAGRWGCLQDRDTETCSCQKCTSATADVFDGASGYG